MSAVSGAQVNPITPQLRAAYSRSGLTMAQIGARAEVSERTVRRLLNGRACHLGALVSIAKVLEVQTVTLWCSSVTTHAGYGA